MPTNQEIAEKLREVFNLMQLAGENRFRAIAFERAAQTIDSLAEPVADYIRNHTLVDLEGVGSSIAEAIYEYAENGTMPVAEELKERVPAGLIRWLDIPGIGPKNIIRIHKELGIIELEDLKQACEDGRVAALSGMGEKSAARIVRSIEWLRTYRERCLMSEALELGQTMVAFLSGQEGVRKIEVAGSLRRSRETIGDIDILVGADGKDVPGIMDAFTGHEMAVELLGRGDTKSSIRTARRRQIDLRVIGPDQFPAALLYFTGSKEHNVVLRQRARGRSLSLNEYGLYHQSADGSTDRDKPVGFDSEEDIYRVLDLHFIPPELRENSGEFSYFEKHETLPLVEEEDIRGVVHVHSTWSDGRNTIEEMARAAIERGYEYLGISDHSRTAAYAGGLTIDQVKEQWDEIDLLNEKLAAEGHEFTIFKGIESDILRDGSLDYPDSILEGFEFVIASIHSGLEMPQETMMERHMHAIEHPTTKMIGHPTGRLLLKREASKLDINRLIEWAAGHGTAIEINANPRRLDLDWRHGNKALETGLFTSINPDAHSLAGIDDIAYGVRIARKGKFNRERVLNTLSAVEFKKWLDEG